MIPLSKIHDLPNVFNPKPQDKTLGSMVLSIESSSVCVCYLTKDSGGTAYTVKYARKQGVSVFNIAISTSL